MHFIKLTLITLINILIVSPLESSPEQHILTLTDSTFSQAISQHENLLAIFYAPWDGHSKVVTQKYPEIIQSLAEANLDVQLVQIDFTAETAKELTEKYEIKHYLTIILFSKALGSLPIWYTELRTPGEITKWLTKKFKSSSAEIKTFEDAQNMIENNEVLAVFFRPSGSETFGNFLQASINPENIAFATCNDQIVAEKLGVQFHTIALFRKFDHGRIVMEAEGATIEAIKAFVQENKNPVFLPFNQEGWQKITQEGLDTLFLFKSESESSQKAEEILKEFSEELKGKLVISVADIDEEDVLEHFEIDKEHFSLPMIVLIRPKKHNLKYLFEGEITIENLGHFVKAFIANKLQPFRKSQPIPEEKYEGNVRIVVGKNFNEVVLDNDNDVLVEYYAPWNGHCRIFGAVYSELARKMRSIEGLAIAKMDWTQNEIEDLEIRHYPELKFYPKGKKNKPLDYDRMLTIEDMIEYLKEQNENVGKFYESVTSIDL